MSRTTIDIDDELLERAMRAFDLHTKRQAVNFALERLVGGRPMTIEEQLEMEGIGWEDDLDTIRSNRRFA